MNEADHQAQGLWSDALSAAAVLALDPVLLGGVALRAPAGEVRDRWVSHFRQCLMGGKTAPWVQVPAEVSDQQLLGGLDLGRTLAEGRPIAALGSLARAHGGVMVLVMAERASASSAAIIATAMDRGEIASARDGVAKRAPAQFTLLVQDEGIGPDERPPAALLERLAFHLDLSSLSHRDTGHATPPDLAAARLRLPHIREDGRAVEPLCAAAVALGIWSDRAPLFALRVARAAAALAGRDAITDADIAFAARMVLAPRATQVPTLQEEQQEQDAPPPPPPDQAEQQDAADKTDPDQMQALEDKVLEAATAAIPPDLLAMLRENGTRAARQTTGGKAGATRKAELRGRPIGSRKGQLRSRARLDLLDTLRTAAPWQVMRGRQPGQPLRIRRDDIRVKRFRDRMASTTIFVVDASGSAAMDRLGEAKGAVELLLADCYVRRDEVALIAFRGASADILLPATRSLSRAKRSLAGLPGGGGTPLAAGLVAAERMADETRRKGRTPTLVIITDGRANVCRDGTGGRQQAQAEAESAAGLIRLSGSRAILVDNAPRPEPKARSLADKMGAIYLPLPTVNAAVLSGAVRADGRKTKPGNPR